MDFMIKQRPKRSYHVSSSCEIQNPIFLKILGVENSEIIFDIFRKIMTPWDPSDSIPGEKLTHLHVKTSILAKKLWILEFF